VNNKLIQQIAGKFSGKTRFETFKDYITDIHFPYYKGLVPDAKIEFKFPLTVLVGENGCGKSSVLQALENVSAGKSLSQRWFSTSVDPIPDNARPCFWYSYYSADAKRIVQILNTRIKKKFKDGSENPDYWEPSRPVAKYGMELFDEKFANTPGATGSRWNGTKRKVEYIDFREEISAFDKYFYFGIDPHKKTKQEYVRQHSKDLKKAIDGKLKNDLLRSIVNLVPEEVSILSDILDKQYQSVKIIEHKFYSKWGTSVYFSQGVGDASFSGKYSEAFAGSGESAVAKLVHKIFSAQEGTLLLLDEPEVSLHPGAQKRLLNYILENVRDKGLQVVISTHSPAIVEELPPEAIVVMNQTALNKFDPIPDVFAETAFQYIGHTNIEKPKIIVEDKTAELLVNRALDICNPKAIKSVKVVCHPGGARDLYKEAVVLSRLDATKTYLLLDGDQQKELPAGNAVSNSELDQAVLNITGIDVKDLDFVADSGKQSEQLPIEKRKFLDFLKSNCKFLPLNTPEEILWKCSEKSPHTEIDESKKDAYKKAIADWAKDDAGGDVSANEIFFCHKKLCNAIPESDAIMQEIVTILKGIVG
jgi:predicted ATPase